MSVLSGAGNGDATITQATIDDSTGKAIPAKGDGTIGTNGMQRSVVEVYNNDSANACWVWTTANDGANARAKGRPIVHGAAWVDSASRTPWYLYSDSGKTTDVRITFVTYPT
jgi:hypothetical protein